MFQRGLVYKGYGKEVLSPIFERLTPEQRASIRCAPQRRPNGSHPVNENTAPMHAAKQIRFMVFFFTGDLNQVRWEARSDSRQQAAIPAQAQAPPVVRASGARLLLKRTRQNQ